MKQCFLVLILCVCINQSLGTEKEIDQHESVTSVPNTVAETHTTTSDATSEIPTAATSHTNAPIQDSSITANYSITTPNSATSASEHTTTTPKSPKSTPSPTTSHTKKESSVNVTLHTSPTLTSIAKAPDVLTTSRTKTDKKTEPSHSKTKKTKKLWSSEYSDENIKKMFKRLKEIMKERHLIKGKGGSKHNESPTTKGNKRSTQHPTTKPTKPDAPSEGKKRSTQHPTTKPKETHVPSKGKKRSTQHPTTKPKETHVPSKGTKRSTQHPTAKKKNTDVLSEEGKRSSGHSTKKQKKPVVPPKDKADKEKDSSSKKIETDEIGQGRKLVNRTPESSHFAVVFLVMIALLFGLYALYHNRQKIIAVVVEGRTANGHGSRDRYRKLDNRPDEPEARIKNSNEVYVY